MNLNHGAILPGRNVDSDPQRLRAPESCVCSGWSALTGLSRHHPPCFCITSAGVFAVMGAWLRAQTVQLWHHNVVEVLTAHWGNSFCTQAAFHYGLKNVILSQYLYLKRHWILLSTLSNIKIMLCFLDICVFWQCVTWKRKVGLKLCPNFFSFEGKIWYLMVTHRPKPHTWFIVILRGKVVFRSRVPCSRCLPFWYYEK